VAVAAILFCAAGGALSAHKRVEQPSPLGDSRQPTAMQQYIEQADAAITAAKESDTQTAAAAVASLSALIEDPLFTMLTKPGQRMLVSASAFATWRGGDPERARDLFVQATRIDGNDPDDWYWLAILELELGDRARSARYLEAFVRRWPELVNNLDRQFLSNQIFQGEAGDALRTAVLQALFDADWNDRQNGVDDAWRELALDHLANGNLPAAAKVIERISDPLVRCAATSASTCWLRAWTLCLRRGTRRNAGWKRCAGTQRKSPRALTLPPRSAQRYW
jgi:tetratricopeptide (TPR) repeat protein